MVINQNTMSNNKCERLSVVSSAMTPATSRDESRSVNRNAGDGDAADKLLNVEADLIRRLKLLSFSPPIEYVYNPLEYASTIHSNFIRKYLSNSSMKLMFLGMNPGPWGMSQNGIPFGENKVVKEWFEMKGVVGHPDKEHPSRKVTGLDCKRSEVSGKRFWELFKTICVTPENFFKHSFVYNICPLAFLTSTGRNVTPAELKSTEVKTLNAICDEAFISIVTLLNVEVVIGVGRFAEKRARTALKKNNIDCVKVVSIPHPSNRNQKNIKNWPECTIGVLRQHDLMPYFQKR